MQDIEVNLINKMFEYNLWANTQLIDLCSNLSSEQLESETHGVFGRIHPTLVHIIRAEGNYLNRVTGSRPWAEDLQWDDMPMSEILAKARLSGSQLIAVSTQVDPAERHEINMQGKPYVFFNWTVLLQALYHGIEHRTQIKFLLTQIGVEHPELAAWDYMDSLASE